MNDPEAPAAPAPLPLAAVEELAARGEEPETSAVPNRSRWAHFERFCVANSCPSLPANEATVLRYIYLYRKTNAWSWRTSRHHVDTIRRIHVENNLADPTRLRVELLLAAIRNDAGIPKDHIKPLLPAQAAAVTEGLAAPPKKLSVLRSAVAGQLARCAGASLSALSKVRKVDVRHVTKGYSVVVAGTDVPIDPERDAELAENLGSLLALVSDDDFLLAPGKTPHRCRANLERALQRMTRRAGLSMQLVHETTPGASLADDQFAWWIAWADPLLAHRVRDAAYILTALACAYRHQNTRVLLISDLEAGDGGFVARLRSNKTPSPTGSDENLVPAVHGAGSCDESTCPACALSRWLRFRTRAGIRDPYVFCRLEGPPGPISAGHAGRRLKTAAIRVGLDPNNLNTRSLRSGTATAMAMSGASTPEIGRITHHRRYSVLAGYIRDLDPVHHRYHLPI